MTEYKTVAELLESPDRWIQGMYAQDEWNSEVTAISEEACKWCLYGAIERVYPDSEVVKVSRRLAEVLGTEIEEWNDKLSRTHAEVLEAVRKAGI